MGKRLFFYIVQASTILLLSLVLVITPIYVRLHFFLIQSVCVSYIIAKVKGCFVFVLKLSLLFHLMSATHTFK